MRYLTVVVLCFLSCEAHFLSLKSRGFEINIENEDLRGVKAETMGWTAYSMTQAAFLFLAWVGTKQFDFIRSSWKCIALYTFAWFTWCASVVLAFGFSGRGTQYLVMLCGLMVSCFFLVLAIYQRHLESEKEFHLEAPDDGSKLPMRKKNGEIAMSAQHTFELQLSANIRNAIIIGRTVEPASVKMQAITGFTKEFCKAEKIIVEGKCLDTHDKSANWGPQSGFVPQDTTFNKVAVSKMCMDEDTATIDCPGLPNRDIQRISNPKGSGKKVTVQLRVTAAILEQHAQEGTLIECDKLWEQSQDQRRGRMGSEFRRMECSSGRLCLATPANMTNPRHLAAGLHFCISVGGGVFKESQGLVFWKAIDPETGTYTKKRSWDRGNTQSNGLNRGMTKSNLNEDGEVPLFVVAYGEGDYLAVADFDSYMTGISVKPSRTSNILSRAERQNPEAAVPFLFDGSLDRPVRGGMSWGSDADTEILNAFNIDTMDGGGWFSPCALFKHNSEMFNTKSMNPLDPEYVMVAPDSQQARVWMFDHNFVPFNATHAKKTHDGSITGTGLPLTVLKDTLGQPLYWKSSVISTDEMQRFLVDLVISEYAFYLNPNYLTNDEKFRVNGITDGIKDPRTRASISKTAHDFGLSVMRDVENLINALPVGRPRAFAQFMLEVFRAQQTTPYTEVEKGTPAVKEAWQRYIDSDSVSNSLKELFFGRNVIASQDEKAVQAAQKLKTSKGKRMVP